MSERLKKESGGRKGRFIGGSYVILALMVAFLMLMDAVGIITLFHQGELKTASSFIIMIALAVSFIGAVSHGLPIMENQRLVSKVITVGLSLVLTSIGFFGLITEAKHAIDNNAMTSQKLMSDYDNLMMSYNDKWDKEIARFNVDKNKKRDELMVRRNTLLSTLINTKTLGEWTSDCTKNTKKYTGCLAVKRINEDIARVNDRSIVRGDIINVIGEAPLKPFIYSYSPTWVEQYVYSNIYAIISLSILLAILIVTSIRELRHVIFKHGATVIVAVTPPPSLVLDYKKLGEALIPTISTLNPTVVVCIWAIIHGYKPDVTVMNMGQVISDIAPRLVAGITTYSDARSMAIKLCVQAGLLVNVGHRSYRYTRILHNALQDVS